MKLFLSIMVLVGSLLAVEVKQDRADVLLISTSMGKKRQSRKAELLREHLAKHNISLEFVFDAKIKEDSYDSTFKDRKLIILDALNGKNATMGMRQEYEESMKKVDAKVLVTGVDAVNSINLEMLFCQQILLYLEHGGRDNYAQVATIIANLIYDKNDAVLELVNIPETGIYNPLLQSVTFKSLDNYYSKLSKEELNQPKIGIAIHRENIVSDDTEYIDKTIEMLTKNGVTPIAFFTKVEEEDFAGERFFTKDSKVVIDALISYQIMIIGQDKLKKIYERVGVPIMQGIAYRQGDQKDWEADESGIDASWIPMMFTIPETIGYTDPLVVAAIDQVSKKAKLIEYQLSSFVKKAINLSKLRHIAQKDKKVSIFYYNYPPGVNNFGASFMNFPASIVKISKALKQDGYMTDDKNETYYLDAFAKSMKYYYEKTPPSKEHKYSDLLDASEYEKFLSSLPESVVKKIDDAHGSYKKSDLYVELKGKGYFIIPRIKEGNILYLPQPSRANHEDSKSESALYHDRQKPLPHHYFAVYLYAKKYSDAFVHLGTHGTHEWSYGKERGLSIYDSGYLAVGDIPLFYPYITNNLAEGIQAKRRGRATLISHQTPPFGLSGIYKELSDILELINQYQSSFDGVKSENFKKLKALAIKMNIHKDMKYTLEMIDAKKEQFVSDLYDNLNGISTTYTPLGMHTYGTYPNEDNMVQTLMAMLGDSYIKAVEGEDGLKGINYKDINKTKSYLLIQKALKDTNSTIRYKEPIRSFMSVAKEYQQNFINNEEISALLDALNGKYIKTSGGGDPIRNPESLPTGRNMYAFDPDKVPTPAAYESGKKLMQDYLANYYVEHGRYPKKITFNLWSLETMRHFGVLESQILYAMGVKPIWSKGGIDDEMLQSIAFGILNSFLYEDLAKWVASFVNIERVDFFSFMMPKKMQVMFKESIKVGRGKVRGVEIISFSDLKRPRIDVVIQATGLYRDAFPSVMQLINEGVDKISKLKEEHNYLRASSLSLKKELLALGYSDKNATMLSTVRMFSASKGEYGNGLKDTTQESQTWDEESKLADNFVRTSGFMYGSDKLTWGTKLKDMDVFSKNLSGTEAVIFSRTSNLYGMMTSDDPFGYFGSLALAVRNIDGKSPDMVIANLRNPDKSKMQDVSDFISNELRSRYFNPKWIKAMQEVGYSGTTNILDVTNNFWGWQVVYPDGVRSDQWQEFVEVYVNDKYDLGTKEWFKNSNPTALAQMSERILEAIRKGYFQTDAKTIQKLIETQEEFSKATNHKIENEKLKDFIAKEIASGFGLNIAIAKPVANAQQAKANPPAKTKPKIKGQKLEEVMKNEEKTEKFSVDFSILVLILVVLFGALLEGKKQKR